MGLYEFIDDLYQRAFNYHEYSRVFVTLAAYLGSFVILVYAIKLLFALLQGVRLYLVAQWCKCYQLDFVERYGKWAVITGATDGIGQSMAKELAARGMSILVIGRNADKLASTKTMLEAIPNVGQVETVKIDLSDSSLENFASIRSQIDPDNRDIGLLINNAGSFPDRYQRFNRFPMEDLLSIANLNMVAPLHMTRMIMPGMVARGRGMLVNVTSVLGFITVPYMSVYSSTKTFMNAFTRQLQAEYSSHPIDIILLSPGPVQTKSLSAGLVNTETSFMIPAPDHYAKAAINALSTRCAHISGTTSHGLYSCLRDFIDSLGLTPMVVKLSIKAAAKTYDFSPVPKRREFVKQTDP